MGKQVQSRGIVVARSLWEKKNTYFLFREDGYEITVIIMGKGVISSSEPLKSDEKIFFNKKRFRRR